MERVEVLVSVIIPVYNAEAYLRQCLDSVLHQTLKNIEVICVDDGSTDNSVEIIKKYQKDDKRVVLLRETNKGAGAARNYGLRQAKGKYIHFLDADDWLATDAYKKTVDILETTEADLCVFLYTRFDNKKQTERKVQLFSTKGEPYIITDFQKEYWHFCNTSVVPWNKMYRRSFLLSIGACFDEIVCANDRAFYFQVITAAKSIVKYAEYLIYYRENNENSLVGKGREKHFNNHLIANKRIFKIGENFSDDIKKRIINMNMLDLFSFFTKSSKETKKANFYEIRDLLYNTVSEYGIDEFKNRSWYPNGKIALLSRDLNIDKKIIPIVFATNNAYAPFLDIALFSLVDNMSENYYYDIYIFETDLCSEYIDRLEAHKGENYRVNAINLRAKLESQVFSTRAHYSKEMYYRILIPELLYHYEKVIYLDCDIVLKRDISVLYAENLNGFTVAAVHNALNNSMFRYVKNMLHLEPKEYFNSGILVINVDEFTRQQIRTKCFDLLKVKENLVCPDQDLLNLACRGTVKLVDSGWNYQWHGMLPGAEKVEAVSQSSLRNASQKKYIIHYTSGKKAWSFPEFDDSAFFWLYVSDSSFEPIIRQIGLSKRINATVYEAIGVNNQNAAQKVNEISGELESIKNSYSFRIGRIITWPLRKIRDVIRKFRN